MNLLKLRQEILNIDREIILLLKKRFYIIKKISNEKKKLNLKIQNLNYENFLLEKYTNKIKNQYLKSFIKNIFTQIFSSSRDYQKVESSSEEK
ncbi:MAG: chorismate mutase [Candidatus Muiribacteriota bacterium]